MIWKHAEDDQNLVCRIVSDDRPIEIGVATLGVTVMLAPLLAYRGFVATYLWHWFVAVPFGVPPLSVAHATGLIVTAFVMIPSGSRPSSDKRPISERFAADAAASIMFSSVLWGMGWIVKQFW